MNTSSSNNLNKSRRDFLSKMVPAGALFCVSCPSLFAQREANVDIESPPNNFDKNENSNLTYLQLFQLVYRDSIIPLMTALGKRIGRKDLVDLLLESASEAASSEDVMNNVSAILDNTFMSNVLKQEIIESSTEAYEVKITECLWAKIFNEENAADLGYAIICHPDFATAEATGRKLIRSKTLMQGHDCCNHRWVPKT